MKNIKYILVLLCISLCSIYAAERPSSRRLDHNRKRSNSEPHHITTPPPTYIVISPRKKGTSAHSPKRETRTYDKDVISPCPWHHSSIPKSFVEIIAHEDKATLLSRQEAIRAKLKQFEKQKEHCEWHIADTARELEELGERGRRECLPICNDQHAPKEQKHRVQEILQEIDSLARDELYRQLMFSDELDLALHNIEKHELRLKEIELMLSRYNNAEEPA